MQLLLLGKKSNRAFFLFLNSFLTVATELCPMYKVDVVISFDLELLSLYRYLPQDSVLVQLGWFNFLSWVSCCFTCLVSYLQTPAEVSHNFSPESIRWPTVGKYKVDIASFEALALPELQVSWFLWTLYWYIMQISSWL